MKTFFQTLIFSAFCAIPLQSAEITLLYDESSRAERSSELFYSANFNADTGLPDSGWRDFQRFQMFDDGQHGDGEADDGVWGITVSIKPQQTHLFEWAIDQDNRADNGWLGTGASFRVLDEQPQRISYSPIPMEATLSQQELENRFQISLSEAQAPIVSPDRSQVMYLFKAPEAEMVYLAANFNNFANNQDGRVDDPEFRMYRLDSGVWIRIVSTPDNEIAYKYVVRKQDGSFEWYPDPFVGNRDGDGNSLLKP